MKARASVLTKYGFLWVTSVLFVASLAGHWTFAWFAYVQEQREHLHPVEVRGYVIETFRDTLENWQSEFLQLVWQVGGLAFLYFVGSPQSKEGSERVEAKVDLLVHALLKDGAAKAESIDRAYPKK